MSIPDTLLAEWIHLASGAEESERSHWIDVARGDPLAAKRWLAETVAARYHGTEAGAGARGCCRRRLMACARCLPISLGEE